MAVTLTTPGKASGDYSCTQDWRLGGKPSADSLGSMDCGDRPLLWPGNDSRSNLFLLLRRGQGLAIRPRPYPEGEDHNFGHSFFSWSSLPAVWGIDADGPGSGSRCDSLSGGEAGFKAALAANKALPAVDREALIKARGLVGKASCQHEPQTPAWPSVASAPGRAFLVYLQAAEAFYAGEWDAARKGFASLARSADPWLAETATYMAIRVEINQAPEQAFNDYGDFQGSAVDKAALARAGPAIDGYLKRYPDGQYAASATGLRRRVAWLAGDNLALARQYEAALAGMAPDGAGSGVLIQEIDNKLLWTKGVGATIHTPLLLAAFDLAAMRDGDDRHKPLSAEDLAAQKLDFAGEPELYTYLTAARALYVDKDAHAVLTLVPVSPPKRGMSPLAYSAQGLRGIALAQLRDPGEEAHWRALIAATDAPYANEFAQFGLALLWQRTGRLAAVFAPSSPITDASIHQILLSRLADAGLLRAAIADTANAKRTRDLALFTLLAKDLTYARYGDFGTDRALIPADAPVKGYPAWLGNNDEIPTGLFVSGKWQEDYACPALATTAATLAANPADPHARLCLGEFWRINGFDHMTALDALDSLDTLGGGKSLFAGTPSTRAALYAGVLANPRASAGDKAYALYRSVMCYAPSGSNDCGGKDVSTDVRKAWFYELRQRYPTSPWAQSLRYYW